MAATATNAVATIEVFGHAHLDGESEIWDVPAGTAQRTLVRDGDRFGVTLTRAPGGVADYDEVDLGPDQLIIRQRKQAGVGNDKATAVGTGATGVTTHGTWEFEGVTGVTVSTVQGASVYVNSSGDLTTTAGSNTLVGTVNYPGTYTKVAGKAPVKIGA